MSDQPNKDAAPFAEQFALQSDIHAKLDCASWTDIVGWARNWLTIEGRIRDMNDAAEAGEPITDLAPFFAEVAKLAGNGE